MGGKSNFLEKTLLDHVFGRSLYDPPDPLYLAIFTTGVLTDASTGEVTGADEVNGAGYARLALPNTPADWATAAVGETVTVKANQVMYEFAPAEEDWGTITQWALTDAPTGGNILYYGTLPRYREIFAGDILTVNAGQLRISED